MHVTIPIGVLVACSAALELWLVRYEPDYGSANPPQSNALPPQGDAASTRRH
jgi:hypothetical protein